PGEDILVGFELATETVVLAQVLVIGSRIAVDHEHAVAVRRHPVAKGGEDRGIWSNTTTVVRGRARDGERRAHHGWFRSKRISRQWRMTARGRVVQPRAVKRQAT